MVGTATCYYTLIPKLERAGDESDLLGKSYRRVATGFSLVLNDTEGVKSVSIHRGFLTNGHSIPFPARKLLVKWLGLDHPCFVLHDWLCEYLLIESNYRGIPINLYEAQRIFYRALEISSLTPNQIRLIKFLCEWGTLWRNPFKATLNPYKRYVEDKSYGICN